MKHIRIIMAILPLLAACTTSNGSFSSLFYENEEISLAWKGLQQIIYDSDNYQIGYNESRHEYRVYDDKLSYWFIIKCSEEPVSVDMTITADVSWTGSSKTKEFKDVEFTVKKVDETGLVWLWSQKEKIEIVIPVSRQIY